MLQGDRTIASLEQALRVLETAPAAHTTVQSPLRSSPDPSWKLDYSNLERHTWEEIRRRRHEFDCQKKITKKHPRRGQVIRDGALHRHGRKVDAEILLDRALVRPDSSHYPAIVISRCTARPARAANATRVSRLNLPTRPRKKSPKQGSVTPKRLPIRAAADAIRSPLQQARTQLHVLRFAWTVFERIPDALKDLLDHFRLAIKFRSRDAAKSISRFAVRRVFFRKARST
jgi:hypothetical protein